VVVCGVAADGGGGGVELAAVGVLARVSRVELAAAGVATGVVGVELAAADVSAAVDVTIGVGEELGVVGEELARDPGSG
jgi:hypothetical protein